jgi:hypothetical protein
MKTLRLILIIFAAVIIIGQLIVIDFKNPGWSGNSGSYLGILAMILLIINVALSYKDMKEK